MASSVILFGILLFVTIGLEFSVYVAGLFNLYTHDLTALGVAALGLALARRNQRLFPQGRLRLVPIGLLGFLLANTVVLGILSYTNVPEEMRRLFWFEHLNALRIVVELLAWVWAFGHLAPRREAAVWLLDVGLWGATASVAMATFYWLVRGATHVGTTTFDLNILIGLPMAMMFVMSRARRADLVRLAVFGAASTLLYSRTSIVAVVFTALAMIVLAGEARAARRSLACVAAGWLLALVATTAPTPAATSAPAPELSIAVGQPALANTVERTSGGVLGGQPAAERAASLVDNQLAPYTLSSRLVIWSDALRIFTISPVFGVGYHNYFLYSSVTEIKDASRFDIPGLFSSLIKQAHSDILSWLVETGIVGFLLLLAFLATLVRQAWRLWRREPAERTRHAFTLAFVLGLLGVSMIGEILIPRTPAWLSSAVLWWALIALLFNEASHRKEQFERPSP